MFVQRVSFKLGGTVEDDSYLVSFLGVIYPVVWDIPYLLFAFFFIDGWGFFCITILADRVHEVDVVVSILLIRRKSSF